jgi:hypothetical protein
MVSGVSGNAKVVQAPSGLHVRSGPTSATGIVTTISNGSQVDVQCRTTGESVNGDSDWDYIPKYKGYVSDAYISKLGASFPDCSGNGGGAAGPTPLQPSAPRSPSTSSPSSPSFSPNEDDAFGIVALAEQFVGTHETGTNCNQFSSALGRGCEAWCADFAEYVWQQAQMDTTGITAYAGSFLTYGQQYGTLKSRDAADVAPGDAVVWGASASNAQHVGIVAEVLANGDVKVINGNYSDQVMVTTNARSSTVSGYGIAGFVSPVPL